MDYHNQIIFTPICPKKTHFQLVFYQTNIPNENKCSENDLQKVVIIIKDHEKIFDVFFRY